MSVLRRMGGDLLQSVGVIVLGPPQSSTRLTFIVGCSRKASRAVRIDGEGRAEDGTHFVVEFTGPWAFPALATTPVWSKASQTGERLIAICA